MSLITDTKQSFEETGIFDPIENKFLNVVDIYQLSKLPTHIIKYILLFDEHFSMRKGVIISIIPKTDYRYKLVEHVVNKKIKIINIAIKERIKTSNVAYLKMFYRSFYYPAFPFE